MSIRLGLFYTKIFVNYVHICIFVFEGCFLFCFVVFCLFVCLFFFAGNISVSFLFVCLFVFALLSFTIIQYQVFRSNTNTLCRLYGFKYSYLILIII